MVQQVFHLQLRVFVSVEDLQDEVFGRLGHVYVVGELDLVGQLS